MLLSVLRHFAEKKELGEIDLVATFSPNFSQKEGAELGIGKLWRTERKGIDFNPVFQLIPKTLRRKRNMFLKNEVDVVLDVSGFAYGDQWKASKIKWKLSGNIEKLRGAGKKVILLPQAFGPFDKEDVRREVQKIVDHANLIFARDVQSLEFLEQNFGKNSAIDLAPDFTNLLEVEKQPISEVQVLIIPNHKLISKAGKTREEIIEIFLKLISEVRKAGKEPEFLIHEGIRDEKFAEEINSELEIALPIIVEHDALQQKKIISGAYAVVTGRFHGLVSSLSQGVPAVALSWSHKYQMLLADYHQESCLIDLDAPGSFNFEQILNDEENKANRKTLLKRAEVQKERSKKMWQRVDELIYN